MIRKNRLSIVIFGALLAGFLALAPAALLAGDEVPFKGKATSQFVGEDLANLRTYFEIVDGNVTHLGKVTGSAVVHWMQVGPNAYVPIGASITLVAANGDELYLTHTPTGWDPTTATSYADYNITGGTGRFEGATGSGAATASGSGLVSNTWVGTIDYKRN
jgi:hypothetical protein